MMSGEKNLKKLIRSLRPTLNPGAFVFTTQKSPANTAYVEVLGQFLEKEGTTLIVEKQKADSLGLTYEFTAAWITLNVHSSLDAVGLTAVFSSELAKNGIGCNVVSAYFHDHIFVNIKDSADAIRILKTLSEDL